MSAISQSGSRSVNQQFHPIIDYFTRSFREEPGFAGFTRRQEGRKLGTAGRRGSGLRGNSSDGEWIERGDFAGMGSLECRKRLCWISNPLVCCLLLTLITLKTGENTCQDCSLAIFGCPVVKMSRGGQSSQSGFESIGWVWRDVPTTEKRANKG